MDKKYKDNKFISIAYDLMLKDADGNLYKYESAPKERPFQFISGIGYALDQFENNVIGLNQGDKFEFTIPCDQAYGPYDKESVLELQKSIFLVNDKFDDEHVKPGAIIPLSDGQRTFNALVTDVREDIVVVDLNHPLAGEDLTFKGFVVETRMATEEEVDAVLHPKRGCGGCGGNCGGNCGGGCGEGGCGEGGCNCGGGDCGDGCNEDGFKSLQ